MCKGLVQFARNRRSRVYLTKGPGVWIEGPKLNPIFDEAITEHIADILAYLLWEKDKKGEQISIEQVLNETEYAQ